MFDTFFKDKSKVKSFLKEGAHCFEKEQKVLFRERSQKKFNETIKSKNKTKELLKEYTKPTLTKRSYHLWIPLATLSKESPSQFIGTRASIIPKSKVRTKRWSKKFLFQGRKR